MEIFPGQADEGRKLALHEPLIILTKTTGFLALGGRKTQDKSFYMHSGVCVVCVWCVVCVVCVCACGVCVCVRAVGE